MPEFLQILLFYSLVQLNFYFVWEPSQFGVRCCVSHSLLLPNITFYPSSWHCPQTIPLLTVHVNCAHFTPRGVNQLS